MGRTAHTVTVALLCGAVWIVAGAVGEESDLVLGVSSAGVLQAALFWRLAGRLAVGRDATAAWVGGIAVRFGAFAIVSGLALGTTMLSRTFGLGFAFGLVAFVLLEALWLAVASRRIRPAKG